MKQQSSASRYFSALSRILIALLFIFSGFVKAVDPFGLALQFDAYFAAFNMPWASGMSAFLGVALPVAELALGLMLLFGIAQRFSAITAMVAMVFFTMLTLIIAIFNPVADCGCFGDAIKLTNWQTFIKNIIILPLTLQLFFARGYLKPNRIPVGLQGLFLLLILGISSSISIYSLYNQPIIDFLPFKVGVNIKNDLSTPIAEERIILTYKDKVSGQLSDFEITDTIWHDTTKWVYVDTKTVSQKPVTTGESVDFSVFAGDQNYTDDVVGGHGFTFVLIASDIKALRSRSIDSLDRYCTHNDYKLVALTGSAIDPTNVSTYPIYNCDQTTLKSIIRADAGLMLLYEGTIIGKWNINTIPLFKGSPAAIIAEELQNKSIVLMISILAILTLMLLIIYRIAYKNYSDKSYKW